MTIFRLLIDPTVFQFESGFVPLLKKPGLGIEINEAKVRERLRLGIVGALLSGAMLMVL